MVLMYGVKLQTKGRNRRKSPKNFIENMWFEMYNDIDDNNISRNIFFKLNHISYTTPN